MPYRHGVSPFTSHLKGYLLDFCIFVKCTGFKILDVIKDIAA